MPFNIAAYATLLEAPLLLLSVAKYLYVPGENPVTSAV